MSRKLEKQLQHAGKRRVKESVFLNVPYDAGFENLFLAYIVGISAFGFTPRATLEIPFGQRRLDRILSSFANRDDWQGAAKRWWHRPSAFPQRKICLR